MSLDSRKHEERGKKLLTWTAYADETYKTMVDSMEKLLSEEKKTEEKGDGDENLHDNVEDRFSALVVTRSEYVHTFNFIDSPMVEQERKMLAAVFQDQIKEAQRAVDDWKESLTWNEWKQVSGDVKAHVYGATFCRADKYGYEFVEIINMEEATGEDHENFPDGVYYVEESYVDRNELDGSAALRAKASWGNTDTRQWTGLDIALALVEYSGYSNGSHGPFKTLHSAMKGNWSYGPIDKEALWEPREYYETWEENASEEGDED